MIAPIDQQLLIDAAAEANLPPGEYFSLWHDVALWQLEALQATGLEPHSRLLDIGCGAMRLGLYAVQFLDDGRYYGVDAFAPYVGLAQVLAARLGVAKQFHIAHDAGFAFGRFGVRFDYANAQSVFTHLSADDCDRCMAALRPVMAADGRFLFTYLVGAPPTRGFLYGGVQPMLRLAVTDEAFFAALGARHGARFEKLAMAHPTGQSVGLYRYP